METDLYSYIGKWIDYPWERNNSPHSLVGDDVLSSKHNWGLPLSKCIAVENDYIILKSKDEIFHVRFWNEMKIVIQPKFTWGDDVQETARPEIQGQIDNIIWHHKDQEYKYYIKVNGKSKSRRYNPDELQVIE